MKKQFIRTAAAILGVALAVGTVAGCTPDDSNGANKNETTPLVLSSEALDSVFNPFFYTAGADGEIVGQTQLGMLSGDKNGQLVAGEDEACVALDFSVVTHGSPADQLTPDDYTNYYTDYYFAIKDDIQFSDGVPLTIKDVLFNIYMYLDPTYAGSSTMYSVDIQGLAAYRTQTTDKAQQDQFNQMHEANAQQRISDIVAWATDKNSTYATTDDFGAHIKDDMAKAEEFFKEELSSDWNSAVNTDLKEYEKYVDNKDGFKIDNAAKLFLYNYGSAGGITVSQSKDPNTNKTIYTIVRNYLGTDIEAAVENGTATGEQLTNYVFNNMLPSSHGQGYKDSMAEIVQYYATATTLTDYLVSESISDYFDELGELPVKTVSGITAERASSIPDENGGTKDLGKEYDILHIRINGVDPKAIQNFGFTVAPMHYYSSEAKNFSLEKGKENFGVKYADPDFMDSIKTNQVPLGAGPYRASREGGIAETETPSKNDFYRNNIVFFERNDHFLLGAPKIQKLRYQVISTTVLYDAVKKGDIDYASPNATNEILARLSSEDKDVLNYQITDNLGYGYIGINANYVNELEIRKAIMHAMDTNLCLDYYGSGTLASLIYRPMSKTLTEYYPSDINEPWYNAYEFAKQREEGLSMDDPDNPYMQAGDAEVRKLVEGAGYSVNQNGIYQKGNKTLKFTFTIAGDTEDHPAYATMNKAREILNRLGFDITVSRDSTALLKLSNGSLEVWAAAWSSSSDPDMYQVYHKDSMATSVNAWGYPWIKREGDRTQVGYLNDLSDLIEEGRETNVVADRRAIYRQALDLVMELAIELPTYQRSTLYVWGRNTFDESTMKLNSEATAYQSPISRIWELSFKV